VVTRHLVPLVSVSFALWAGAHPPDKTALNTVRLGTFSHRTDSHETAAILSWNIDRGKNLSGIEAAIEQNKPEICIFQEVDLDARRTGEKDVAQELAQRFGMNYAFAPEFQELSQSTAGGAAYHGQAILTTLPIRSSRILRFEHQTGFWKPHPFLISGLPMLQRREGGRIAQVAELDNGGRTLVIYNLHLESKWYEHLRVMQLEEVLADAQRYPAETPLIIAGDFNTFTPHSAVIGRLESAGYHSSFGDRRIRTHALIGALDWVFVKGPITAQDAQVLRTVHASDHFPISLKVKL